MAEPFYFISYSRLDGEDLATRLGDQLTAGPPSIAVWIDRRRLQPGIDWDEQLVEALRTCEGVLFLMTQDSVSPKSECKREWTRALKYKKPIIPLLFDADAELPYRLEPRQFIDFAQNFDAGLARLRDHVRWRGTPEGTLQTLRERLEDARRDLGRAEPADQARIREDVGEIRRQIREQQRAIENPQEAQQRAEKNIQAGLERERQPAEPVSSAVRTRFINRLPMIPPIYFQNRHVETGLIGTFLKDASLRLMTVVGRGGVGKTAMVCRLLRSLEAGTLPDDGGALTVSGIVYLSARAGHPVNFPNLFADLCKLLPEATARRLDQLYRDSTQSVATQMQALLAAFPDGRTIVLLDNFEDAVDAETQAIKEYELGEALRTVLEAPPHGVKFLITTRVAPQALMLTEPAWQQKLELDKGLGPPYAEEVLKAMDADGTLGLHDAKAPLAAAREATRGYPKALEAIVGILRADRTTTLSSVLGELRQLHPQADNVVQVLVGEAFNRLDPTAQQVMQALAIYGAPVPAVAVDYLLQPYRVDIDSARALRRLVNMHVVRGEAARYYLHQVDRDYALSRVAKGTPGDRGAEPRPFTRYALRHRAAEYFKETRKPREAWKTLDDLAPQLAEFDVRVAGEEYDAAASILNEISFEYLQLWGHGRLALELDERLVGQLTDKVLLLSCHIRLGICCNNLGECHRAIDHHQQALAIAREAADRPGEGAALGNLGTCYFNLGDYRQAIEHHENHIAIARETGDRQGEGGALGNLGTCHFCLGDYRRAIDHHEQHLAIARQFGDRQGEANSVGNRGNCYYSLGEYRRAIDDYEQQLTIARAIGDRLGEGNALGNLGNCYEGLGDYHRAIGSYEQHLAITRAIGDPYGEGNALGNLGICQERLGDYRRAAGYLDQQLAITRAIGDPYGGCNALNSLGMVSQDTGDLARACEYFRKAGGMADSTGNRQNQHETRFRLALASLFAGDFDAARAAIDAAQTFDYPQNSAAVWAAGGIIRLRQGERTAAREAFATAVTEADRLIERCAQNVSALDTKGLALCGLALCEDRTRLDAAAQAFASARAITQAQGVVASVLRLVDAMAAVDAEGVLPAARRVAAGH